jgi:hypothetical protein
MRLRVMYSLLRRSWISKGGERRLVVKSRLFNLFRV